MTVVTIVTVMMVVTEVTVVTLVTVATTGTLPGSRPRIEAEASQSVTYDPGPKLVLVGLVLGAPHRQIQQVFGNPPHVRRHPVEPRTLNEGEVRGCLASAMPRIVSMLPLL